MQFTGTAETEPQARENRRGSMSAADKRLVDQLTTGTAWAALPYATGWSDVLGGNGAGLYKKDPFGRVWLSGAAKKSSALVANDLIATLPAGYYNTTTVHRWYTSHSGHAAECYVDTAGGIRLLSGGDAAGIALDGASFDPAV